MSHATPPEPEAVAAARYLGDAVNGFNARIDAVQHDSEERDAELRKYGRRNRRYVLFDIALTILFAIFGGVLVHAADQASQALTGSHRNSATVQDVHAANLAGCRANNLRLARQEQVLNGILRTPAHSSQATRAYLAHARAEIALGWGPRDCTAAYRLKR